MVPLAKVPRIPPTEKISGGFFLFSRLVSPLELFEMRERFPPETAAFQDLETTLILPRTETVLYFLSNLQRR